MNNTTSPVRSSCPHCGVTVLPDVQACPHCGSDLNFSLPVDSDTAPEPVLTETSSTPRSAVRAQQLILLSCALFLLALLASFGYQGMTAKVAFKKSGAAGEGAKPIVDAAETAPALPPSSRPSSPVLVDTATLNRLEALHQRFLAETDSAQKVALALALSKEYIDLQQLDRAGFYVRSAATLAGAKVPQLWLRAANLYDDAEDYVTAKTLYETYLSIEPKNVDARVDYAIVLLKLGEQGNPALSQQAVTEMRRAVEDGPQHQKAHVNLGILYMQIGKVAEAHQLWQRAIELDAQSEAGRKARELIDRFPLPKP